MDTVLLAIIVIALSVAFVMSLAAWRLSADAKARSAARVAALADAANVVRPDEGGLPSLSLTDVPAAATAADTPAAVDSRQAPWTPARVSPFMRSQMERSALATARAVTPTPVAADVFPPEATTVSGAFLASATPAAASGGQRHLAAAAAVLFVALLGAAYWVVGGSQAPAATPVSAATTAPLELVSLRHERRAGRLAVTGLVRNPTAGRPVERLTAVVLLFDQQGSFITSARAHVDFLQLAPGDESPFVVDVDAPSTVARYRVSFRTDAGAVTHIDRRGQAIATTVTP